MARRIAAIRPGLASRIDPAEHHEEIEVAVLAVITAGPPARTG